MSATYHRRITLMKRPPLVRNSSPIIHYSKPKKSVRFCDESLENVRLFLKTQMPKACQSDATYEPNYHIKFMNWNKNKNTTSAVRVEQIQLENDILLGTCQVANIAFEKQVTIHYSFDNWNTVHVIQAKFKESIIKSWDRFNFKIDLNQEKSICLAVKYTVLGRDYWDNNNQLDFKMKIVPKIELQLEDDDFSSSSEEEEEEEEKPLFANRYDDVKKPWSPPLSPTTPVDANPLWIHSSIKNGFFNTDQNELIRKYCFHGQQTIYNS